MSKLIVRGGKPLSGTVSVAGSKNAALPILAATLLTRGKSVLHSLPRIGDTDVMRALLAGYGVICREGEGGALSVDTADAHCAEASPLGAKLRASLYLLGASLAAFGEGHCVMAGGCDFGGRPIDLHLGVLRALGAEVVPGDGEIHVYGKHLVGTEYTYRFPSVGATVNGLLAAVRARGRTVLRGIAAEPHIADLIAYLRACGAEIETPAPRLAVITGVECLHGAEHTILPDMIEAGSYLLAVLGCGGRVCLQNTDKDVLLPLLSPLEDTGVSFSIGALRELCAIGGGERGVSLTTAPYPGFPTDLHPQMAAYLSSCRGESVIRETVWPGRFRYVPLFRAFGAEISRHADAVYIRGVNSLCAADVTAPDLRAGFALLALALRAKGETVISGAELILRGYEELVFKLRSLGADIIYADA